MHFENLGWGWITILTVIVIGFGVSVVILYSSINALNNYYSERLGEKDNAIVILQNTTTKIQSEKADLENKLGQEVVAKTAALQTIKTLNWQFKDATRERAKVEASLAVRLDEANAEAITLKASLDNEVASKKMINDQLQETKIKLVRETGRMMANLDLYWSVSKDLQWEVKEARRIQQEKAVLERQLDTAKKLVDGALFQATGQPIKAGKTVKLVVIVPADVSVSIANIDALKPAIEKTCAINQLWFFVQAGETFSCEEPIVVRGKKNIKEYDGLEPAYRIYELRKEVASPDGKTYVFFLWGSGDRKNWGGLDNVLINEFTLKQIVNHDAQSWGVVAHELGHAWGLPHLASEDKIAIMRVNSGGWAEAIDFFPYAVFTDAEKNIIKSNLKK